MQILVLLGMYFDAVVVFVTSQTLLLRLALAILCHITNISKPLWILYQILGREYYLRSFWVGNIISDHPSASTQH